jgi:gas vesicle protein
MKNFLVGVVIGTAAVLIYAERQGIKIVRKIQGDVQDMLRGK